MQSKQLVPGISFSFDFKHKTTNRLVHSVCQSQLRKSPYEESPEKPFLVDFSMYKRIIGTYHDLIVDVQLNLITTDAEFETHRVGFSICILFQYVQADHCNMSLS